MVCTVGLCFEVGDVCGVVYEVVVWNDEGPLLSLLPGDLLSLEGAIFIELSNHGKPSLTRSAIINKNCLYSC